VSGGGAAVATQLPPWHVPALHGVLSGTALHSPFLRCLHGGQGLCFFWLAAAPLSWGMTRALPRSQAELGLGDSSAGAGEQEGTRQAIELASVHGTAP
jgi:hypothetical protein